MSSDRRRSLKEHNDRVLVQLIRDFERTRGAGMALAEAARHGLLAEVTRLLDAGTDVDARDESLVTPLMLACYAGRTSVAKLLVERGANVNATDAKGWTPLMSLMGGLQREATIAAIVKLLLKAGADPSIRSPDGVTALDLAREKYGDRVCDLLGSDRA